MKVRMSFVCLSLLILTGSVLTGCTSAPRVDIASTSESGWIVPQKAIFMAAQAAPEGVDGVFALKVLETGSQRGQIFLNSELDYRDQRNLTIAISEGASRQLAQRYQEDPQVYLKGKNILVSGAAVRTKIHFVVGGRLSEKYYYQTHVHVSDARQIAVR
jgi:hypothetical protein